MAIQCLHHELENFLAPPALLRRLDKSITAIKCRLTQSQLARLRVGLWGERRFLNTKAPLGSVNDLSDFVLRLLFVQNKLNFNVKIDEKADCSRSHVSFISMMNELFNVV